MSSEENPEDDKPKSINGYSQGVPLSGESSSLRNHDPKDSGHDGSKRNGTLQPLWNILVRIWGRFKYCWHVIAKPENSNRILAFTSLLITAIFAGAQLNNARVLMRGTINSQRPYLLVYRFEAFDIADPVQVKGVRPMQWKISIINTGNSPAKNIRYVLKVLWKLKTDPPKEEISIERVDREFFKAPDQLFDAKDLLRGLVVPHQDPLASMSFASTELVKQEEFDIIDKESSQNGSVAIAGRLSYFDAFDEKYTTDFCSVLVKLGKAANPGGGTPAEMKPCEKYNDVH